MQMRLETIFSYIAISIHHLKKKDGEKLLKIFFFYLSKQDHSFLI